MNRDLLERLIFSEVLKSSMNDLTCPVCSKNASIDSEIFSKYSSRKFTIARCSNCSFGWITNPNLDFNQLYSISYYQGKGADKTLHYFEEKNSPLSVYAKIRTLEFKGIEKAIRSLPLSRPQQVLDYGGGLGTLTDYLNKVGISTEMHDLGNTFELAGPNTRLASGFEKYNVITLIEVLEHLVEPQKVIKEIGNLAEKESYLLITTGNLKSHKGRISDWQYMKNNPDVHVAFWSKNSLDKALSEIGFSNLSAVMPKEIIFFKIFKGLLGKTPRKLHGIFNLLLRAKFLFLPLVGLLDKKYRMSEIFLYKRTM